MRYTPQSTLAKYSSIPHVQLLDLKDVPMTGIGKKIKEYKETCSTTTAPEREALYFYTLNHCAAVVRSKFTPHETLPAWAAMIMEEYNSALARSGERMFVYLCCILTRESRHFNKSNLNKIASKIEKFSSANMLSFINLIASGGSDETLMQNPPDCSLGEFSRGYQCVYHQGKWQAQFGGQAWGTVADCLSRFAHGEFSLEMMLDTAFTLAHNGGPIFDKGIVYDHYGSSLITILDIQRSGQMLDLCLEEKISGGVSIPTGLKLIVSSLKENAPEVFGHHLDWRKVLNIQGAPSNIYNIQKMDKVYGAVVEPEVEQPVLATTNIEPVNPNSDYVDFFGVQSPVIGSFDITPDESVHVVKRVGAK